MIDRLLISVIHFLLCSRIFKFFMPNIHAILIQLVFVNSHPFPPPHSIRANSIQNYVGSFRLKKPFLSYSPPQPEIKFNKL